MNLFRLFWKKIKFIPSTGIKCLFYSIKIKQSSFHVELLIKNAIFPHFCYKTHESKRISLHLSIR
jgi:hypothetical protein